MNRPDEHVAGLVLPFAGSNGSEKEKTDQTPSSVWEATLARESINNFGYLGKVTFFNTSSLRCYILFFSGSPGQARGQEVKRRLAFGS